jgi:energy-coupling factor transporter transmembrane protein EcfT
MKGLIPLIRIEQLRSRQKLLLLLLLGFILSVTQASAYIDPGTASMVWQLMLAVVLASAYAVHTYWIRIKNAIIGLFKKSDEKSDKTR